MFQEIEGNLIELADAGHFDVIAHGCNTDKRMGAGIALQIAKRWPEVKEVDLLDQSLFGTFSTTIVDTKAGTKLQIFNLYTQRHPGKPASSLDSAPHRYRAIEVSTLLMQSYLKSTDPKIGLPLIGCGLAGLKWDKVKEILQRSLKQSNVTIVHLPKAR